MARLLRKKVSDGKKKKKQVTIAVDQNDIQGDGGVSNTAVAEVPAREVKKKPAYVPKKAVTAPRSEPGKIRGYIDQSIQFLREVKVELKKVTWPSRKQTMGSTVVVLVLVMIVSIFLGMADIGLSSLIRVVLQ